MNDDFGRYLTVIISGSQRTRAILYFLLLTLATLLAVYLEFNLYDWPEKRFDVIKNAYACFVYRLQSDKDVPLKIDDNDAKKHKCSWYYNYAQGNYGIPFIIPGSTDINFDYSKEIVFNKYKELSQQYVETRSTTIPLIGTRLEKNSGVILGNLLMLVVFWTLRLSFVNESDAVHNIYPLVGSIHEANMVISCHVFSKPGIRRRFSWGRINLFWGFLFLPSIFSISLLLSDIWQPTGFSKVFSFTITSDLLGKNAWVFYGLEMFSTVLLAITSVFTVIAAQSLDKNLTKLGSKFGAPAMRTGGGVS